MIKVLFAPLQGYTDAIYRQLHNKHFGGIDKYYAPYLRFEPNKDPKNSVLNDLLPENNKGLDIYEKFTTSCNCVTYLFLWRFQYK